MSAGSCKACGGSGLHADRVKRQIQMEGATCGCANSLEHRALEHRMDASYKKDDERAQERFARTTAFLRARVTKELNGG